MRDPQAMKPRVEVAHGKIAVDAHHRHRLERTGSKARDSQTNQGKHAHTHSLPAADGLLAGECRGEPAGRPQPATVALRTADGDTDRGGIVRVRRDRQLACES